VVVWPSLASQASGMTCGDGGLRHDNSDRGQRGENSNLNIERLNHVRRTCPGVGDAIQEGRVPWDGVNRVPEFRWLCVSRGHEGAFGRTRATQRCALGFVSRGVRLRTYVWSKGDSAHG
jgi:hypothetical protein